MSPRFAELLDPVVSGEPPERRVCDAPVDVGSVWEVLLALFTSAVAHRDNNIARQHIKRLNMLRMLMADVDPNLGHHALRERMKPQWSRAGAPNNKPRSAQRA